jgi:hypothetical protein
MFNLAADFCSQHLFPRRAIYLKIQAIMNNYLHLMLYDSSVQLAHPRVYLNNFLAHLDKFRLERYCQLPAYYLFHSFCTFFLFWSSRQLRTNQEKGKENAWEDQVWLERYCQLACLLSFPLFFYIFLFWSSPQLRINQDKWKENAWESLIIFPSDPILSGVAEFFLFLQLV